MSDGNGSTWTVIQTFLMAGVLVACVTVTCSNSALEERLISIEKAIADAPGGGSAASSGPTQISHTVTHLFPGGLPIVPGMSGGAAGPPQGPATQQHVATTAPPSAAPRQGGKRVPGEGSGVQAVGWGGRRAEVTFVEGAPDGAPLTLDQKPVPQGDVYVNRRNSAPKSLNYYCTNEGETDTQTSLILGRMMAPDPAAPTEMKPQLATHWEVSDDSLTYTYHLRRGVQFADGRPFSSKDVMFSWAVLNNTAVNAQHLRAGIEDIESVLAPDELTVVVKYRRLYWAGLYDVGLLKILNRGWYEAEIQNYARQEGVAKFSTDPSSPEFGEIFNKIRVPCPGTGPYHLARDTDYSSKRIALVQNPFWFGTQVYGNRYNVLRYETVFITDDVVADEEFRKGNFDVMVVSADRWDDQLKDDPKVNAIAKHFVYDHTGLAYRFVAWNCRKPPFDDARVRRAMTHLLDREWLLREVHRGRGAVATCPTKSIYPSFSPEIKPWPYSPTRAREILAEAGWKDTNGDGVLDRDGRKFEFQLKYPSGFADYGRIADAFVESAKKAGVLVTPVQLDWSVFIQDFYDRKFDAITLVNSYSSFVDAVDPYSNFHSSQDVVQGGNHPGWHNDEVDRLLQAMREEFDEKKRWAMFHRFNQIFHEEQPMTLLTYNLVDVLASSRFENLKVWPAGLQWFEWWVKPENVRHR